MKFVKRIVIYLAGLFFVALGVAFSVNSNLGISPVNSLPYVVSRILGKDLGTCVTVIFIGYILIQILLLRKLTLDNDTFENTGKSRFFERRTSRVLY